MHASVLRRSLSTCLVTIALLAPASGRAAVYFAEDFQDNTAGWTLDTEWQIGSATASAGHQSGNPDPGMDHTATGDNGVAGAVIGGNVSVAVHGYYYLTSPVVNTSAASELHLRFWRHLNSDVTPYMRNRVEVWDGATWQVVWQSGGVPAVRDANWTLQSIDVSTHANAQFQVRFGHQVGAIGSWIVSGWNLDDVEITDDPCEDLDGDTYVDIACGGTDCDDSDPDVHPGATEVCDGVDNNCDGTVDEGLTTTFYADSDGDGHGNPAVHVDACSAPPSYVSNSTDCDDSRGTVYPGAPEICDGLDNDCDSVVDDGLATSTYYADADGDGYGNPGAPISACAPPIGYVANNTDCNDLKNTTHPGAAELCDGADNDCDFVIDEGCPPFAITSISDVANDQGRQVRVWWVAHVHDQEGTGTTITSYSLYRRIEEGLAPSGSSLYPPGEWDFVEDVPANGETAYAYVAPTLCDSTEAGVCLSTFFVRAQTDDPLTYFDSPTASGYSVDNLAPSAPKNVLAQYAESGNTLSWDENEEADLKQYRVYRSTEDPFDPGPGTLVHTTVSPGWVDPIGNATPYYYLVTAVDLNGNESPPSAPGAPVSAPEPEQILALALSATRPNPFTERTTIEFAVPIGGKGVTLRAFDVAGRAVRTLYAGTPGPGPQVLDWDGRDDGGVALVPGTYYLRLVSGGEVLTRTVTILR